MCVDRDILEKFMDLCVKDFSEAREGRNRRNIAMKITECAKFITV